MPDARSESVVVEPIVTSAPVSPSGSQASITVAVAVSVGVSVGVNVGVLVAVAVLVAVFVAVAVEVLVAVAVGVPTGRSPLKVTSSTFQISLPELLRADTRSATDVVPLGMRI